MQEASIGDNNELLLTNVTLQLHTIFAIVAVVQFYSHTLKLHNL